MITKPANAIFQTVPGGTSGTDGASGIDISNPAMISSGGAGGGSNAAGVGGKGAQVGIGSGGANQIKYIEENTNW